MIVPSRRIAANHHFQQFILGVILLTAVGRHRARDVRVADRALQMLTLEGWVEIRAAVLAEFAWAWLHFGSFVFVAVFVVVNLFIAVVINNLESVKLEQLAEADRHNPQHALLQAVEEIRERLDEMERRLRDKGLP